MPRPAGHAGISAGREGRASVPGGRRRGGTVVRTRLGGRTARTSRHTRFRAGIHRGGRDGAVHRRLAVGESRNARFLVGAAEAAPAMVGRRRSVGGRTQRGKERMVRWLKRIALLVVALVVFALVAAWMLLRGSLPELDGEAALPGLSTAATVQRDRLGVVTIDAASEADAMRALGYVHAQERYFGMDLMRRTAAGELSALFGPAALDFDKRQRVHRMRARATANLRGIAGQRTAALRAYTEGVNAGLAGLHVRPWPYLLLGQAPEPWRTEDSALPVFAVNSEEHTSELQSLMRTSYAVFCLKKKNK